MEFCGDSFEQEELLFCDELHETSEDAAGVLCWLLTSFWLIYRDELDCVKEAVAGGTVEDAKLLTCHRFKSFCGKLLLELDWLLI